MCSSLSLGLSLFICKQWDQARYYLRVLPALTYYVSGIPKTESQMHFSGTLEDSSAVPIYQG